MRINLEEITRLINDGDLEKARQALNSAINENPLNAGAWELRAVISDDPKEQAECYRRILQIDPGNRNIAAKLLEITASLQQSSPTEQASQEFDPILYCKQCGGPAEVHFVGHFDEKKAICSYCGAEVDLPDSFRRLLSLREQQHDSIISRQASQTISEETVADEISKPAGAESYPPRLQKIIELLKEKGSAALGEGHLRELEGSEIKLSAETDGENLDNSSRSSENYQPAEEQDDNRTDSLEKNQDSLSKPADKPDKDSTFLKLPFFNWKKPDRKRRPLSIEELVLLSGEPLPPEERRQCPNPGCGAVISKSATTCPWCGHSL